MLTAMLMIFQKFALLIGSILPLQILLDDETDTYISFRGLIIFFFIIVIAYNLYDIFSKRRNK